jgi:hypothetical protein
MTRVRPTFPGMGGSRSPHKWGQISKQRVQTGYATSDPIPGWSFIEFY